MHESVQSFVARVVADNDLAYRPTLEVGSFDVNGSPRKHFTGEYVGVDLRDGPGVDRVADAERLPWSDGLWPVVLVLEMLEHALRPYRIVEEAARVCAPGGFVLASARGFDEWGAWRFHGFPDDHYRFGRAAFGQLFEDAGLQVASLDADPVGPGWLLLARKPLRDVYAQAAS